MSCVSNHRRNTASTSQSLSQLNSFDQTSAKQLKTRDTVSQSPTWDIPTSSCQERSLVTPGKFAGIGTPATATTAEQRWAQANSKAVIKPSAMPRLRTILLSHLCGSFLKGFQRPDCSTTLLHNQQQTSGGRAGFEGNICVRTVHSTELWLYQILIDAPGLPDLI